MRAVFTMKKRMYMHTSKMAGERIGEAGSSLRQKIVWKKFVLVKRK
jgi:hypothetical protein